MSKFKENNFIKTIFSLLKPEEQNNEQSKINQDENNKNVLNERIKIKKKEWMKECNPIRSTILWGYDNENNPSFLILYGEHKFKSIENNEKSINNILEDYVKYTSYAIFKGKQGHLPAFQAVKIIEEYSYYRNSDDSPKMYYKTGLKNNWYWSRDENYRFKDFITLSEEEQIILPYFESNSYEEYIKILEEKNIEFSNFKLVKHPNEILKLEGEFCRYYEIIYDIISNENLYMRKKSLNELLEKNPEKEILELFMKLGSTELVSGIFLELAKRKNPILLQEAKNILQSEITWAEESYIKGLKRCACIYMTALDDKLKNERIKSIYETLVDMDLHLVKINEKNIPEGKILEGYDYRKYAAQGLLREYQGRYDYEQRKWVEYRSSEKYKVSEYSDGVVLKTRELKSTLQEAEIYGLADVVGKIAYYLDAPRLNYYFRGNDKTKELKYYKRYARRIIDFYAKNDSKKFIEAMKALLTSYTKYDYVCKFRGNFQFNEFLKYYLYYDFKEKPPIGWENYEARNEWMKNDQLMKLKGRYEFMKEIWDDHLQDVLEIASEAKINPVLKACYYILKDSDKTSEFIDNMPYSKLIALTEGTYEPLANMFKDLLNDKLKSLTTFESKIMMSLMSSPNEKINEIAKEYINRSNGVFLADELIELLMLDNIDKWADVLKECIISLSSKEYCNFIKAIANNNDKFIKDEIILSKDIRDVLSFSTNKVFEIPKDEKERLILDMISVIFNATKMQDWIQEFIEEVIFSISYEELNNILQKVAIGQINKPISQKSRQVLGTLDAIKNKKIPSDTEIIGILETATSKMIRTLFEIIKVNKEELSTRFSTLLIMLESDITILNKAAEEIFDDIAEEKRRRLHGIIIDSPVNKVYSFGLTKLDEAYKNGIPKEFIIQMMEHTSSDVKAYISNKTNQILNNLGNGDKDLFMYYIKTLLFLPNKVSKSKDNVYEAIPKFVLKYKEKLEECEDILLDIGGSNNIIDSERALTTLAKIKKEVVLIES